MVNLHKIKKKNTLHVTDDFYFCDKNIKNYLKSF